MKGLGGLLVPKRQAGQAQLCMRERLEGIDGPVRTCLSISLLGRFASTRKRFLDNRPDDQPDCPGQLLPRVRLTDPAVNEMPSMSVTV